MRTSSCIWTRCASTTSRTTFSTYDAILSARRLKVSRHGKTWKIENQSKLGVKPFAFVMDKGFYSRENLDSVASQGIKFLIPVPRGIGWARHYIQEAKGRMLTNVDGFIPKDSNGTLIQSMTFFLPEPDGSRRWLHVYCDDDIAATRKQQFLREYRTCYQELCSGETDEKHQDFYDAFFAFGHKAGNGRKVKPKQSPETYIDEQGFGYWCLYTNAEKDAATALSCYRERNDIEVLFDDLENGLDCDRLRVHHPASMFGRLFIQFVALILLSSIRKDTKEQGRTFRKYAVGYKDVLRRVSTFSKVEFTGKYRPVYTTPTKGQQLIFEAFGIDVPGLDSEGQGS